MAHVLCDDLFEDIIHKAIRPTPLTEMIPVPEVGGYVKRTNLVLVQNPVKIVRRYPSEILWNQA